MRQDHDDITHLDKHLIGQLDVSLVLQQVLHHPQFTMATGCDEGRVSIVLLLNVQLSRVFTEEVIQLVDVSIIRCLTGGLRRRGGGACEGDISQVLPAAVRLYNQHCCKYVYMFILFLPFLILLFTFAIVFCSCSILSLLRQISPSAGH